MTTDTTLGPAALRHLLAAHGLGARKSLGQHYLVRPDVVQRIVEAVDAGGQDVVFEVGPGPGVLTVPLARLCGRLVAVELDSAFEPLLRHRLTDLDLVHTRFVWADALKVAWPALAAAEAPGPAGRLKLVGNLPYNVTGPLLATLLQSGVPFERLVVMIQAEVADRLAAAPGSRRRGFFSVMVQWHAQVETLFAVPRSAFWPAPRVDSAVVRLIPHAHPPAEADGALLLRLARAAFTQRRKTLANALAGAAAPSKAETSALLRSADVDPERRAETLSLSEWAAIARRAAERTAP